MIMADAGASKCFDESGYQFLSKEKVRKLETSKYSEEDIKKYNEMARNEMNTFLANNTLLKCTKINDTFPLTFVMGFEKEGKSSVMSLLDGKSSFTEEITYSLSLELDKDAKTIIRKKISENNAKVVLFVLSCAIHRGGEYFSPVIRNLTNLQIGDREYETKCLVVLTHAKSGLKGQSLDEHFENQLQEGGSIADLYRMAYPNIIAVEATEGSPYGMKRQREQVLSHLSRLLNILQGTNVNKTFRKELAYFLLKSDTR